MIDEKRGDMTRLLNQLFGWREILVTGDLDTYMRAKAVLADHGVEAISEFSGDDVDRRHRFASSKRHPIYYLFVKKDSVDLATDIINGRVR